MARRITLRSSDGEVFEVDETVAIKSQTIKDLIEVDCDDGVIPLHNVNSKILSKVLEYCQKHVEAGAADEELESWDAEFVKVDQATLFGLLEAANYLNITGLQFLTAWTIAYMIRGRTPEELRETFNIENDLIKNGCGWGCGLSFLTRRRRQP